MRYQWEITQHYGLRCRAENSIRKRDAACERADRGVEPPRRIKRVAGTGYAGVRGHARSHRTSLNP